MAQNRPRPARAYRRLSVRLLTLVTVVPLLIELCFFITGIQRERSDWLRGHLAVAELAAFTLMPRAATPQDAAPLRHLTGADTIIVTPPAGAAFSLWPGPTPNTARVIDPGAETWLESLSRALAALPPNEARQPFVVVQPLPTGGALHVYFEDAALSSDMRHYARRFLWFSVALALSTGLLIFITLQAILIAPLARITRNIAAFRADPQRAPLDLAAAGMPRNDEIGAVARELFAMQSELRTALWRNARLAAVGTAMAKMSHDLRGVLSAALLVADRLTTSKEDRTREAGEVIVRAVHRATTLAQSTLDFVRQGPPSLTRQPVCVRAMAEEAALGLVAASTRACTLTNGVDPAINVNADRECLIRVFANLMRNAAQAGATRIDIATTGESHNLAITLTDNGPGLPEPVAANLFRPFGPSTSGGSGLGLAIARDLMRAHGGDLQLKSTSPEGTAFLLLMQMPRREDE